MSVSKRSTSLMLAFCFVLSLIITVFPVNASANNEVYENAFNIQAALDYAKQWAVNSETLDPEEAREEEYHNPDYERYPRDCTNFVSQCLATAGLRKNFFKWTSNTVSVSVLNNYAFINARALREHLENEGYSVEKKKFDGKGWVISDTYLCPSAGDIVQFDWGEGEGYSHSVLCMGEDANGVLKFASHCKNRFDQAFTVTEDCDPTAAGFAVIYMTDTRGMEEVTSEFVGKFVAIKSNEVNQYVYADDNGAFANRSNPVLYEVVRGDYGAVGFRAPNGKFLSADLNAGDSRYASLTAKYGNLQNWESFRIFRKGRNKSDYYIQSQATGKWVQAVASGDTNHTVKAAARAASTWERFDISASPVINGEFFIRSTVTDNANKMLDIYYGKDSTKYGKNIQLYEFNGGNNQKFYISHMGNGWHRIQSVASWWKSLDVEGGYSRSGTNVILWSNHDGDNQCWRFIPDGYGFRIQSKLGFYLDVYGGFTSNETNVQIWEGNGGSNQRWKLYKTSNGQMYTA